MEALGLQLTKEPSDDKPKPGGRGDTSDARAVRAGPKAGTGHLLGGERVDFLGSPKRFCHYPVSPTSSAGACCRPTPASVRDPLFTPSASTVKRFDIPFYAS